MTIDRFTDLCIYKFRKAFNLFISALTWLFVVVRVAISQLVNPNRPHIAILLAEHFGDIIACEPLSREIKARYPTAKVYWIIRRPYRELVEHNPHIDVVVDEYSVLFSILLTKKHPFDKFYNCHVPDLRRYKYTGQLLDNPLARSLGIYSTTFFNHGTILEAFTKIAGLPVRTVPPVLYIPERATQVVDQLGLPTRYIVLHCHSNFTPKDWKSAYWDKLVDELIQAFSIQVVEVGLKSTLTSTQSGYHNLCGRLSLLETAEVIKRAGYFIGIDSGPAHMANAVGTFGFLLFGKLGTFTKYMPYSGDYQALNNVRFIMAEPGQPCSALSYDAVWPVIYDTIKQREAFYTISDGSIS